MAEPVFDHPRSEAFADRMMDALNGAGITLMMSIGHQVGLFDAMAGRPPATSEQIAAAAGLSFGSTDLPSLIHIVAVVPSGTRRSGRTPQPDQ